MLKGSLFRHPTLKPTEFQAPKTAGSIDLIPGQAGCNSSLETKVSQGLQDVTAAPRVPMLGGEVAAEALLGSSGKVPVGGYHHRP